MTNKDISVFYLDKDLKKKFKLFCASMILPMSTVLEVAVERILKSSKKQIVNEVTQSKGLLD